MTSSDVLQKINQVYPDSMHLESSPEQVREWSEKVLDYLYRFLDQLGNDKAYQMTSEEGRGILDMPIQDQPRDMEGLLKLLDEQMIKPGIAPASGGHLGYIPGGGIYPAALGDLIAAVTNKYAGVLYASPGAVRLENQLIRWMCSWVGYPEEGFGNLTSGGSIANLVGVVCARDASGISAAEISSAVIYLSGQVHHAVMKSIHIAGLAEAQIRAVPMDEHHRMDAEALEAMVREDAENLKPFLVVASLGTTDVGAVDPLDEIADVCEKYGLWFHIDAAYGGAFLLLEEMKEVFRGVERSDSIVIDPHKGLFLPYGSGAILVRNVRHLLESNTYRANYMQDIVRLEDDYSPADLSPELSKHFRGLRMWLPLQLFGVGDFKQALREKIYLTQYFHLRLLEIGGFELGPFPRLSVTYFRYLPDQGDVDEYNQKLIELIHEDGRVFLSSTKLNEQIFIRMAVLSFRTHVSHMETAIEMLISSIRTLNQS